MPIHFRCRTHRQPFQRLWQVSRDEDQIAGRPIEGSHQEGTLTPGGWVRENRPLDPGLYCQICLASGVNAPLADYDAQDLAESGLADAPHVGLVADGFDADAAWGRLTAQFGGLAVASRERRAEPARFDDRLRTDRRLAASLSTALHDRVLGGGSCWAHQAEAIDAALGGADVVVETATASGKSLCYWVPVLNGMLSTPKATALYLAPLNALVEDQLQAVEKFGSDPAVRGVPNGSLAQYVRSLNFGGVRVNVARYDGTIRDNDLRKQIRSLNPQVVITNPDMLHYGMLPHHAGAWSHLFANLRYVVLDEMHVYKGMFGSNFANVLRRVLRLADHYGQRPQLIACSASIGNPKELFRSLTGRASPTLIPATASGAPVHRQRRIVLDLGRADGAMATVAKDLMLACVAEEHARTIAFMRSIPEVDQVYRYVTGELKRIKKDVGPNTVREYKREIPPNEKARVTADLRSGATLGVISTTALQLGIDIGDLSVCIVSKFPGSKAAFFQQAGRVGRRGESLVLFLADESPLDQHFVRRPPELLDAPSEVVFLNPDHHETVLNHLWCADEELRLDPKREVRFWGEGVLPLIEELASGRKEDGRDVLLVAKKGERARDVNIRSLGFECVVRDEAGEEVARPDVLRAVQRFHKYARFQIQDQAFEVTRLSINWNEKAAEATARRIDRLDYTTASVVTTECSAQGIENELRLAGDATLARGPVRFNVHVDGYYRIPTGGNEEPRYQHLGPAAPPERELDTQGLWFGAPVGWLDEIVAEDRQPSVTTACQSLRIAAALLCSTDPDDIGTYVEDDPQGCSFRFFLADNAAGGNGLTQQAFLQAKSLLDGALRILEECPHCQTDPTSRGCPKCVTTPWGRDADVCRSGGVTVLRRLRSELE